MSAPAGRPAAERPTLSVVIVARDEADAIADCIESVQACVAAATSVDESAVEVLLVDSNSSDGTVDIATEYPITVLRIPRDELCSGDAGRDVGFRRASGDYVLFVDGDMTLDSHWLDAAVGALRRHADVAGVDGWLTDRRGGAGDVAYLRGVALYDAGALAEVGGFDPRIKALGDVEVGLRLRGAGYRLRRLPLVVAAHPPTRTSSLAERLRRWRQGYYFSNGVVLRTALGEPRLLARWLYRDRLLFAATLWLLAGAALAVTRHLDLFLGWTGVSVAGFLAVSAVRGVRWTVMKFTVRLGLFLAGVAVGLYRGPTPVEYPHDQIETVQRQPGGDD